MTFGCMSRALFGRIELYDMMGDDSLKDSGAGLVRCISHDDTCLSF